MPAFLELLVEQARDVYGGTGRGVRRGDVVLDCGAYVGVVTRRALDSGARLVVAIEPSPGTLACLRLNLQKESETGRVVVYPKGVWDRDADLQLSINEKLASTASSVALQHGAVGATVPLTTIDKLVQELKLDRVDFVKMDIEGAEPKALQGASRTIARFRPRMAITLEHRPSDADEIPPLVERLRPHSRLDCTCLVNKGIPFPEVLFVE
jgi:FkbM family methyltransferase